MWRICLNEMEIDMMKNTSCNKISEFCTGTFREKDGTLRAAPGSKCKAKCVTKEGRWGSSWCYTESDKSQWGAECVKCKL